MLKGILIGLGISVGLLMGVGATVTIGIAHFNNFHAELESAMERHSAILDNLDNLDSALAEIEETPIYKECVADLASDGESREFAESRCAGWLLAEPE